VLRDAPPRIVWALEQAGVHPLLARLFAGRGVRHVDDLDDALARLHTPEQLRGAADAARLLADAIRGERRICIVADYDCDGATACAVGFRALSAFGADVGYLVPNRFEYGYGLTPEIVELASRSKNGLPDQRFTFDHGAAPPRGPIFAGSSACTDNDGMGEVRIPRVLSPSPTVSPAP